VRVEEYLIILNAMSSTVVAGPLALGHTMTVKIPVMLMVFNMFLFPYSHMSIIIYSE
jgi:hypothetical protein